MVAIIKSLQSLGYKVTFWPNDLEPKQPYTTSLQQMGVEVVYGNVDFMQFSKHFGHAYDVVSMSRPEICARYINSCRSLYPNAKLIYDTVDLHYLRLGRQAKIETANAEQLVEQSKWYEKLEKGLMERVDGTIVVSQTEVETLKKEGVTAPLFVVSNIHKIDDAAYRIGFAKRRDVIFVGNYAHLPNRDAVRWLKKEILPLVAKEHPGIHMHIVGANMPDELASAIKGKNITVHGFVSDADLYTLLEKSRVFIAPLRYGAGVKGKVGQAIEYGIPTVSTSVAAEGMYITDGLNGLVADSAKDFADAIVTLNKDRALWEKIQLNAKSIIAKHFSIEQATKQLKQLLK
jgi:glycosyltransferase involved in cell wall biosynthesis